MPKNLTWSWIWYEMARRKVQFHPKEKWDKIQLWGLFNRSDIQYQLKKGWLIENFPGSIGGTWVRPTKETWLTKIKPLIERMTLEQLTSSAGWDI